MSVLHKPPPAQPADDHMMFGTAGPFNVKELDEPTRAGIRNRASRPSSPDQLGIEIAPRGEMLPLMPAMAATNARVVDQPTQGAERQNEHLIDGREDSPYPGELAIPESMGDTTLSSAGNPQGPAGTPARGFGNIGFQAGQSKSVVSRATVVWFVPQARVPCRIIIYFVAANNVRQENTVLLVDGEVLRVLRVGARSV